MARRCIEVISKPSSIWGPTMIEERGGGGSVGLTLKELPGLFSIFGVHNAFVLWN